MFYFIISRHRKPCDFTDVGSATYRASSVGTSIHQMSTTMHYKEKSQHLLVFKMYEYGKINKDNERLHTFHITSVVFYVCKKICL